MVYLLVLLVLRLERAFEESEVVEVVRALNGGTTPGHDGFFPDLLEGT
jgi:hypothetical protein